MLSQQMVARAVPVKLKVMRPGRRAASCAENSSLSGRGHVDLVVVDFSDPDHRCLSIVSKLAFGEHRIATPIVLLTSDHSEELLDNGAIDCDSSIMFAPTSLSSFLDKIRELSREELMSAVTIVSGVGPILVRLPGHFMRTTEDSQIRQVA